MKRIRLVVVAAIATVAFAASAIPAFGDGSGAVDATVTATAPCITISNTSLDFGVLPFSPGLTSSTKQLAPGTSRVANCSGQDEYMYVRGTNATAAGATWELSAASRDNDPCVLGRNKYGLELTTTSPLGLSAADRLFASAGRDAQIDVGFGLTMPCSGSDGAGQSMTFQYVFTATF